jgi:hypothetical protein
MALIGDAVAQGIIDRIAYIRKHVPAAASGGTTFYARVTGTDDPDVELPLGDAAYNVDQLLEDLQAQQDELWDGLVLHLARLSDTKAADAAYSSVDAWLTAREFRVPIQFSAFAYAKTGSYLSKSNVYDDVKVQGVFTISGAGAGSFSAAAAEAIDTVHTGGNNMEAVCTTGVTSCSLTVTLTKPDGTSEEKTITVAGEAGDTVAIGSADDIYTAVTACTINSGGAEDEVVTFRSKLDRPLAL